MPHNANLSAVMQCVVQGETEDPHSFSISLDLADEANALNEPRDRRSGVRCGCSMLISTLPQYQKRAGHKPQVQVSSRLLHTSSSLNCIVLQKAAMHGKYRGMVRRRGAAHSFSFVLPLSPLSRTTRLRMGPSYGDCDSAACARRNVL